MAARLVLNRVVQGRGSTACTRLGSNRWMVSVKSRLGFVHVDVFWGSVSVNHWVYLFTGLDYWTGILDWNTGLDYWTDL